MARGPISYFRVAKVKARIATTHAREALGDGARGERPLGRAGDAIETLWGGGPDELISG